MGKGGNPEFWPKMGQGFRLFIGKFVKFLCCTFAPKTMFLGVISGAELDLDTSRTFLQKSIFDPYMTPWPHGFVSLVKNRKILKSRKITFGGMLSKRSKFGYV